MKILYIECSMGAAGDMLAASLLELIPNKSEFIDRFNALQIPSVSAKIEDCSKCNIKGTRFSVSVNGIEEDEHLHEHHHHDHHHEHHHHDHHTMADISHIVGHLNLPQKIKSDVLAVYELIAEAESHSHGVPIDNIHFHEVGTMDAIADITAVCLLMYEISPQKIIVSPIKVGSGEVRCAHGILPVPAPATAYILKDVPIYSGDIKSELCTPTGAALLKHFGDEFGTMPVMKTDKVGYGMGKKDFETANCVRAFLGEADDLTDVIYELSCNVDDMSAEDISFATDRLLTGGAREVYTVPVGMKKSRTGTLIRVMCSAEDKEKMLRLIFKHTTTIGVRESKTNRYVLDRKIETIHTKYGDVRCKTSFGYGVTRSKYEYDDLSRIAKEHNLSLQEVRTLIENE